MNIAIIAIGLLILSVVLYKKPAVGIIIAILIATTGELGRLPESTGLPYLANDLFLPFFAAIWILKKISFDRKYKIPQLLPPILLWTVIAGFSLLLNSSWLESSQLKESALYLVRFVEYFFLYLITVDESKSKQSKSILIALITGAVLISIFGFVQLELYPSFYHLNMMQEGWDPHINRLLSTWFDPNFVGGLLGFIICILFGLTIGDKEITKKTEKNHRNINPNANHFTCTLSHIFKKRIPCMRYRFDGHNSNKISSIASVRRRSARNFICNNGTSTRSPYGFMGKLSKLPRR